MHSLFPLPLTLFEEFQLADQRPGYPQTFIIQLAFLGRIEQEAFERAVRVAVARHPLLATRVEPLGKYAHTWVPVDGDTPIDWASIEVSRDNGPWEDRLLGGGYGQPVDLYQRAGLSIWVRQGDQRSEVRLQFHHACCDGIGGFRFVEDLLVAYAAEMDGDQRTSLAPLDTDRLAVRGHFGLMPRPWRQRLSETRFGIQEAIRFYRQAPLPIALSAASQAAATDNVRSLAFVSQRFSSETLRSLRVAATDGGAKLNDLLLHDLFLAIRDWNAQHDEDRPERYLRVVMPTSMRGRDDLAMPAANVMSYSFLTRRTDACQAGSELLGGLRWETAAIQKHRLSLYFIGMLAVAQRWRFLMSWGLRSKRCFATAVLTNLGDPTRRFSARFPRTDGRIHVGNLLLEDITGVPPLRPMTRAVFSITTYANRLTISTMCDGTVMTKDDARGLLDCFVSRTREH